MSTIQQLTTTAQKSWQAVHPLPSSGNPDGTRIIALRNPEPCPSPIRLLDETGRTLTYTTLPPDSIHTFLIPNEPGM